MRKGIDIIKQLKEKLGKSADAGDYIDDFKKSDAPQFKGKSDKKKEKMAVAAYLDSKEEVDLEEEGKELTDLTKHFDKKKFGQDMVVMYKMHADPDKLKRMTTNKYAKQLKKLDNTMGTMKMKGDKEDHLDFVKYMHMQGVKPTIKVLKAGVEYKEEVDLEERSGYKMFSTPARLKSPEKGFKVDFGMGKDSGMAVYRSKKDAEEFAKRQNKLGNKTKITPGKYDQFDNPREEVKEEKVFVVRFEKEGMRFAVPFRDMKMAKDGEKILKKSSGVSNLSVTQDVLKPGMKLSKEQVGKISKEEVKEEKRQLKDPKKEAMVMKVKDSGSIMVIDKKDLEKYLSKGYIQVEDNIQEARLPSFKDLVKYKYGDDHAGAIHFSKIGGKEYHWNYVGRKGGKYFVDNKPTPEIRVSRAGADSKINKIVKEEIEIQESGHTDVASMKTQVQIATDALQKMNTELGKLSDEEDLPTWWTNKVATAVGKLDGMSDYIGAKQNMGKTMKEEYKSLNESAMGCLQAAMIDNNKSLKKESKMGELFLDMQMDAQEMDEREFIKVYTKKGFQAAELKSLYKEFSEEVEIGEGKPIKPRKKMSVKDVSKDIDGIKRGKELRIDGVLNPSELVKQLKDKYGSKIKAQYGPSNITVTKEELDNSLASQTMRVISQTSIKEKIDPADIDDIATADDRKAADKNIIIQLRRAQDMKGKADVTFKDNPKKKEKIDIKVINKVLDMFDSLRPNDKAKMQTTIGKSYRDLLKTVQRGR